MSDPVRTYRRYSEAFKLEVLSKIDRGELTIQGARRLYDIRGKETIQHWIKRYHREDLLPKQVRIQMPNEVNQLKALAAKNKALESALADAHLKIMALESLVEVAEETYKVPIKKNSGPPPSSDASTGQGAA